MKKANYIIHDGRYILMQLVDSNKNNYRHKIWEICGEWDKGFQEGWIMTGWKAKSAYKTLSGWQKALEKHYNWYVPELQIGGTK